MKISSCAVWLMLSTSVLFAAEKSGFKINHNPYLQSVDDTSATVVWTTNAPAVSWVEIAPDDGSHFYEREREKFFDSPMGKKQISTLHKVKIDNLKKGMRYNYRIFSQEVTSQGEWGDVTFGKVDSSAVYKKEPLKLKTLDESQKTVKFSIVNDIHADAELLKKLLSHADANADFFIMNGDMVSAMQSQEQVFKGFLDAFIEATQSSKPIFFARGNHESRGQFSEKYLDYFPTPTGKPYYAFKTGCAFFVILDGGEDKPDNDIEYHNMANFDKYRTDEATWLSSIVDSEDFKNAAVKIVVTHIPPAWGSWHGSLDFKKKFAPILNGTGIDTIISGHLHRGEIFAAGSAGFDAINIANDNKTIMNVSVDKDSISIDFIGEDGKPTRERIVQKTVTSKK